jgi:catechol 2,3-dioxygenase-like lactoylglutathione lyase family enzyme
MTMEKLDHVALWVSDRDTLADFLTNHLGLHVIDRTDRFTLVGADAREGKLTLFAADGPRETGALERVVLRVRDLDAALARLPDDVRVERPAPGEATFAAPEGLGFGLHEVPDAELDYDLDRVVLRMRDPERALEAMPQLGFERHGDLLEAGGKALEIVPGGDGEPERPLLNHVALLVDSARDWLERGLDVADEVDGPNTYAVFVWGPERLKLEYVEHKPNFSLV